MIDKKRPPTRLLAIRIPSWLLNGWAVEKDAIKEGD